MVICAEETGHAPRLTILQTCSASLTMGSGKPRSAAVYVAQCHLALCYASSCAGIDQEGHCHSGVD